MELADLNSKFSDPEELNVNTVVKLESFISSDPEPDHGLVPPKNLVVGSCVNCKRTFKMRSGLLAHKFKCSKINNPKLVTSKHYRAKYYNETINSKTTKKNKIPRKYYQCDQSPCTRIFPFKHGLAKHKIRFHGIGIGAQPSKCQICSKTFANEVCFKDHIRIVHDLKKSSLACPGCDTKFLKEHKLSRHLQLNKVMKKTTNVGKDLPEDEQDNCPSLSCPYCNQPFEYNCEYKKHISRCVKAPLILPCPECSRTFPTILKLQNHKYNSHRQQQADPEVEVPNPPCPHCGKQFKSEDSTRIHIHRIHGLILGKKYKCEYCDAQFNKLSTLKQHTVSGVTSRFRLNCKQCGKKYQFKCQVKQHRRDQVCERCKLHFTCEVFYSEHISGACESNLNETDADAEGGYPCIKCSKIYSTFENWNQHYNKIHNKHKAKGHVPCIEPGCSEVFKSRNSLIFRNHWQNCHKSESTTYTCPHCDYGFRSKKGLISHLKAMLPKDKDKAQKFICDNCNQMVKFEYKCAYKKHVAQCVTVPATSEMGLHCPNCPKTFLTSKQLKFHKYSSHQNPKVSNPPCPHCGKQFKTLHFTRFHIRRVHNPKKPKEFECEYCHAKFDELYKLNSHREYTFGQIETKRRLDCKQCGTEYFMRCQIRMHIRNQVCEKCKCHFTCEELYSEHISGGCEKIDTETEGGYPCNKCSKIYSTHKNWDSHYRTHDIDYPCNEQSCNKVFNNRYSLGKHRRKCHSYTKFTCPHCECPFKSKESLNNHLKLMLPNYGHEEKFNCENCNEIFEANCKLKLHRKTQKCGNCSYEAECRTLFTIHIDNCKSLPMPTLGSKFSKSTTLVIEVKTKPKKMPSEFYDSFTLSCPHCHQKFTREVSLQRHLDLNRSKKKNTRIECSTCDKQFEFKCEQVHHTCICNYEEIEKQKDEIMTVDCISKPQEVVIIKSDSDNGSSSIHEHLSSTENETKVLQQIESDPLSTTVTDNIVKLEPSVSSPSSNGQDEDCGGPFHCWACGISFDRKTQFFEHIRTTHNEEPE